MPEDVLERTLHDEARRTREDGPNSAIDESESVPAFHALKYDLQELHPGCRLKITSVEQSVLFLLQPKGAVLFPWTDACKHR